MVTLGILGFAAKQVQRFVPPYPANRLAGSLEPYLAAAQNQRIDWHPLGSDAFAEARQQDRAILLVIGAPWSERARNMDRQVFSDPDIDRLLAQSYVCVRVDVTESPEWIRAGGL